jgi:hypothetical protein
VTRGWPTQLESRSPGGARPTPCVLVCGVLQVLHLADALVAGCRSQDVKMQAHVTDGGCLTGTIDLEVTVSIKGTGRLA